MCFLQASEDALDLLSKLVAFDPRKRLSAVQAIEHSYFRNAPRPSEADRLPKPPIRAHNPLKLQYEVETGPRIMSAGSRMQYNI